MDSTVFDSVMLSTSEVTNTVTHYVDKIHMLETFITVESVVVCVLAFLAIKWGMALKNKKTYGE